MPATNGDVKLLPPLLNGILPSDPEANLSQYKDIERSYGLGKIGKPLQKVHLDPVSTLTSTLCADRDARDTLFF